MYKVIFPALIFFLSGFYLAGAVESQWYWVSVPSNPEEGYFIEGPNVIGKSTSPDGVIATFGNTSIGHPYIKNVQTPLPSNFIDVLEETESSSACNETLDSALNKLREFDSENEIVDGIKSSVWANEESSNDRISLMESIVRDSEQCLEEEHEAEERAKKEAKRIIEEKDHLSKIEKAVEQCNFEFFAEEMTAHERMQTYDERMACEKKYKEEEETETVGLQTQSSEAVTQEVNKDELLKQIQDLLQIILNLQQQLNRQQSL